MVSSYKDEKFKALFVFATESILVTDDKGIIQLANPATERLFGYSEAELIGQKIEILIPSRFTDKHIQYRSDFCHTPSARSMGSGRDLFGKNKNGEEIPVEVSLSPFNTRQGKYVIAFIIDITVRKQHEADIKMQKEALEKLTTELEKRVKDRTMILEEALEQLEKSREELRLSLEKEKDLNEMKSRFVSMASHEFRTPLATILSSLTLVSKYGELGEKEKQHRHIQRIKNSISYLTDLLNDVLSISKLEEGKVSIVPLQCKAEDYIKQILEDLKPLTKKGQIIRYTHSGNALMCQDVKILKIIITNLVSNAIKFSNENTIVELRTKASSHLFEIEIQDYGVGISAEDQEHLFERFFRGNNVTNIQGTGLGLNIVARYLEILGGEIHVKSQLNEGTTFLVQLPNIINYE